MMDMKKLLSKILCAAAISATAPAAAYAVELHGRISESVFMLSDDATVQNYNYSRTRLNLDATDIYGKDETFRFDGSYRTKGQYDYNSKTPDTRVDVMNIEMRRMFADTDVTLGRQYIDSLIGARVDGVLFQNYLSKEAGVGAFGGTAPDPYSDDFTSAFTTYGAYGFWKEKSMGATAGYASTMFKGKEDTAYLFGSGYLTPDDSLSMYSSLRMDHNITTKNGWDITNLLLTANYRWDRVARVNLALNQYRGLWMQESMDYNVSHEMQRSARVYADYNITREQKLYTHADYRTRDSDNKSASLYGLGYKISEMVGSMYMNAAYRGINYFTTTSTQMFLALGAQPMDDVSAEFSITSTTSQQEKSSNDMSQMIYSASADWQITKSLYFNGLVEYSAEKFLSMDSVYLAKYKDEYKSTAIYANLAYRF